MLLLQNGTWLSSSQRRVFMFLQNAVQSLGHLAFFFPRVVQTLELLAFFILTAGTRHSTVQQWLFMLFLRYALLFNGGHPSSPWWASPEVRWPRPLPITRCIAPRRLAPPPACRLPGPLADQQAVSLPGCARTHAGRLGRLRF